MRPAIRLSSLLFALLLSSAFLIAQTAPNSGAQAQPDVLRAMFDVRTFKQVAISPDGTRVAWVENLPGSGGAPSRNSTIYVADVDAPGRAVRITAENTAASESERTRHVARRRTEAGTHENLAAPHEEDDVAWSPDGRQIAFLSDVETHGQLQLYVIDLSARNSRPKQLTHFTGFLTRPQWSPDGKTIALLYIQNAKRVAGPLAAETPDVGVISETYTEQRLVLVDPSGGNARQISPGDMYIYEFDWSPDSRRLVFTAAHGNGDDNWWIADIYSIDAASGAMREILPNPKLQMANVRWSPDGREIAFIGGLMSDQGVTGGDIFTFPAEGGTPRDLTRGMRQSASSFSWASDSHSIFFTSIIDGDTAINRLDATSGGISQIWRGAERVSAAGFTPDVSLSRDATASALVRQSFSQPPEVWAGPVGQWKRMTNVNASLHPAWGKAVSLDWDTGIGNVQGWLVYPANFDSSKKYPMVVVVHGGPASATLSGWPGRGSYYMALPSQGYFLLFPNPRGSYGQGERFTRANVKDFGYGDWTDILAGVDKAIQSAPIDPNRLGLTGWSYGGFMTMWGVTHTHRFHAAVAGAGLSDWLSYYGENKIDQWMIPYFGASVYDDPGVYAKSSPINYVKNVTTPTLMLVGQYDGECPAPQSLEFWHALETLHVPTRLVIYPNEGHGFVNPAHNRDVMQRTIDWFDQYLGSAN
ncbi:MAG TPA: S9 family peptidase [Candidatus Acidoferrum sp.]|nr:S9 family peptidase [Candidatus Acidoferrum sp.]